MYYCTNFSNKRSIRDEMLNTTIEIVDFGNNNSAKEDFKSIELYLKQIKSLKKTYWPGRLEFKKEIELFDRVKNGDEKAKEIILMYYLINRID